MTTWTTEKAIELYNETMIRKKGDKPLGAPNSEWTIPNDEIIKVLEGDFKSKEGQEILRSALGMEEEY